MLTDCWGRSNVVMLLFKMWSRLKSFVHDLAWYSERFNRLNCEVKSRTMKSITVAQISLAGHMMRGPMRMVMAPFQLKLLTLSNQQEGLGSSREKHSLPPMGCGAPFQPSGGTRTVTHPCLMCFSHPVLAGFIVNTRGNNPAHPTQNSH